MLINIFTELDSFFSIGNCKGKGVFSSLCISFLNAIVFHQRSQGLFFFVACSNCDCDFRCSFGFKVRFGSVTWTFSFLFFSCQILHKFLSSHINFRSFSYYIPEYRFSFANIKSMVNQIINSFHLVQNLSGRLE